jgi:hypothetical protein
MGPTLLLTAAACEPTHPTAPSTSPPAQDAPPATDAPNPVPATARTALPELRKLTPEERKKREDAAIEALRGRAP